MSTTQKYYKEQLEKLGNIKTGYAATIQIRHDNGNTKWLSLNDESATEIVKFLTDNFNIGKTAEPVKDETEAQRLIRLRKKYPLIVRYCDVMSSFDYWTNMQLEAAEQANAPKETYRMDTSSNKIYLITDIQNQSLIDDLKNYL